MLFLLGALVFLASCQADVLDLVDSDFDSTLAGIDTALVMFYAPWCGHCKKLKPEFEMANGDLLANDPPVTLVKVDCTEGGKDSCNRFEVKGYPTLKIFKNGELSSDYNGPREAKGIVKFMKTQVGPASKELKSVADADKLLALPETVVLGLGDASSTLLKTFLKAADKLREDVKFGHSAEAAVLEKLGVEGPAVVLYRPANLKNKFEESSVAYAGGESDKAVMVQWIKDAYHGLCGHRTPGKAKDFGLPLVTAYYDVDYAKNPKGTNYWRNRVLKVAKEFPGYKYAVSNKDDFQQELSEFGLEHVSGDEPVVTARDASGQKYKMEDKFSMPALTDFLTQLEAGNLEPYMKSEALPDNSGNVKVAVAKNFDELVTKSEKDVLIEFYAPWCGHCKKLTPIYDELGDKMAEEDVEIVKMDATANDVPPTFDVKGFPTLYWLPKNSKKPVTYNGGREVDEFVKYIAEHATDELKGYTRKGKEKKSEL